VTTTESTSAADVLADLQEVARKASAGGVKDDELLRQSQTPAEEARRAIRAKFGERDIGVGIIREARDSA
jgi:hypothetical protein